MRSPIRIRTSALFGNAGRIYRRAAFARKATLAILGVGAALAIGLGGCRGPQQPETRTPSATQSPTAAVSATAAATPQPSAPTVVTALPSPGSTPLDTTLDQIERNVEEIRGLRFEGETKRRFVDSATLAAVIDEELDKPEIQEQIAKEQKLYRLLGLIESDADLDSLYRGLLGSQVLGLYDPDTEEFLVLHSGEELTALAESTYSHEYAHLLQDVRFDLDALSDAAEGNSDRELALAALIEGDATITQLGYGIRFMSRARLNELMLAPEQFEPPPEDTPFVLLQGLEFPYTVGPLFVAAIRGNSPGFDAVNRAFEDPPETTEQVMHPEKYRSREDALQSDLPDVAEALGDGWTAGDPDVLGEFMLKTWLAFLGRPNADTAAAGWGGDTFQILDGPDGESAVVARITWDRPEEDGGEFFETLVAGLDRQVGLSRVAGTRSERVVWETNGRAIGVERGAGATGTFLAAAARAEQVASLLDSATRP